MTRPHPIAANPPRPRRRRRGSVGSASVRLRGVDEPVGPSPRGGSALSEIRAATSSSATWSATDTASPTRPSPASRRFSGCPPATSPPRRRRLPLPRRPARRRHQPGRPRSLYPAEIGPPSSMEATGGSYRRRRSWQSPPLRGREPVASSWPMCRRETGTAEGDLEGAGRLALSRLNKRRSSITRGRDDAAGPTGKSAASSVRPPLAAQRPIFVPLHPVAASAHEIRTEETSD